MDTTTLLNLLQQDPNAKAAYDLLSAAGGSVYIVGGAVRDLALEKTPKDIDLMVTGLDGPEIEQALSGQGRLDLTGKSFGVYRFKIQGKDGVEIAMPRVEYGKTNVDFYTGKDIPVEDDLGRRDFTANAMAVDATTGQLIDPYNGAHDIAAGNLSLVNPNAFADDPTRLLRGVTAISKHDLMPDQVTYESMKNEADTISSQPPERLQMELDKILAGNNPSEALRIADQVGLLKHILPEVSSAMGFDQMNPHHDLDVGSHLLAVLDAMTRLSNDPDLRLAALLHDIGKPDSFWRDESAPEGGGGHFYKSINSDGISKGEDHEELGAEYADQLMRRLRYPNDRRERVVFLIRNHMFAYFTNLKGARKFLNKCGGDAKTAFDLFALREADASGKSTGVMKDKDANLITQGRELLQESLDKNQAITPRDLAINGNDLIQMGVQPGPGMGEILNKLLNAVLENPELNSPETLKDMVLGLVTHQNKLSAEPIDRAAELQKYYKDEARDRAESIKRLEAMMPDYKWSWDGEKLDVWPTKSFTAEDHFERTGPGFRQNAQGRIYVDEDGSIELHVWHDRGTEQLREQGIEEADQWCLTNLGESSDIVTYEKEAPQQADWEQSWIDAYEGEEQHEGQPRSLLGLTDDEWNKLQAEGYIQIK